MKLAELQQNNNLPQILFNLIYGLICVSPILGGEYTGILAAIAYLQFLTISGHRQKDLIVKLCTIGFVVSVIASLALAAIHWDVIEVGKGKPKDTIIYIAWFAVAFMLIDAVRFQIAYYRIDLKSFAVWLITIAAVSLVGKVIFLSIIDGVEFLQAITVSHRTTPLVDMNSNHSDDVVLSVLLVTVWAVLVLNKSVRNNPLMGVIAAALILYCAYLFFGINSRAGILGIAVSLLVVLAILTRLLTYKQIMLLAGAWIVFVLILPNSITGRLSTAVFQIGGIVENLESYRTLERPETPERQTLRENLLALMAAPPKNIRYETAISQVCKGELNSALDDKLAVDASTSFRFLMLVDGVRIWQDRLVLGYGTFDRVKYISEGYNVDLCSMAYFSHIHNNYLDLAIRGGLVGLGIFALLSLLLAWLIRLSFIWSGNGWLRCLPVLAYFPYLYIESLFGMTFNRYSELIAVQFAMIILLSMNLQSPERWQEMVKPRA